MIPLRRRLEYTSGYLTLGLLKQAAAELDAIKGDAAQSSGVLLLRMDLYHQSKQWRRLVQSAAALAKQTPDNEQGWISWAYALRELERIPEAQDVLHRAEPTHGTTCAVLHYNLACYACLLGDKKEAMTRLALACEMDAQFKTEARDDPDLASLQDEIANRD